MGNHNDVFRAIIKVFEHLKQIPLDEVHANIDTIIKSIKEGMDNE